jgi:inner membrane protein
MDNITHGLLGAAIALLRPKEEGPDGPATPTEKAVLLGAILAAEAPDLDVLLSLLPDPMAYYTYHRGLTHSVLMAPVWALITTGIAKLIHRKARPGPVFGWSLAAVLVGHLLDDWLTGWGTRLLYPLSSVRYAVDWVPIVDLFYLVPLIVTVILALRRPHLRKRLTIGLFAWLLLYTVGYRGVTHHLVTEQVARAYAGKPVARLQVSPDLFHPLRWRYAVDLGDRYEQGALLPGGPVQPDRITPTHPGDPVVAAVRRAPELRPFFEQFAFVAVDYVKLADGYRVTLGDIRYNQREAGGIVATVLLGDDLRVQKVEAGF